MIQAIGEELSHESKAPKTPLRRALKSLYDIATAEDWKVVTIAEYLYEWIGSRRHFAAGSTAANQQTTVKHFDVFMGDKMEDLLDSLTPGTCREFAVFLVEKAGHSPESANVRLESITGIFNRAVDDGLIETNPWKGITVKVRKSKSTSQIDTYHPFTYKHLHGMIKQGLAEGVNPEMAVTSLVAMDLGGRIGDMFGLLRSNFTLEEGLIEYHVRKVTKLHGVIMFPTTVALLQEYFQYHMLDKSPTAPLAPTFHAPNDDATDDDLFRNSSASASAYFGHFLQAVGIRPIVPPRMENGQAHYDHSFHSFRPTVSTGLKVAGVPLEAFMARMPHKSEEVSKKYNRFTVHTICQRVFEGVGLPVRPAIKAKASVKMSEIWELTEFARQRLIGLRGKLDLYDGPMKHGVALWRAKLIPVSNQMHFRTRAVLAKKGKSTEKTDTAKASTPQ